MRTGDFCTSAPTFGLVAFRICAGNGLAPFFSPSEKGPPLVHKSGFERRGGRQRSPLVQKSGLERRGKDGEKDGEASGHERALVFVKLDTELVTYARAPRVSGWFPFAYVQVAGSSRPSRQARRTVRSCKSRSSRDDGEAEARRTATTQKGAGPVGPTPCLRVARNPK